MPTLSSQRSLATITACSLDCAGRWAAEICFSTTVYRPPPSCPPHSPTWKPPRGHGFTAVRDRHSYAKDRGCTKPGCDAPAYHSQVHHVSGWTNTGRTDIDDLTLACGIDNRLAEKGWTTRKNANGETEWLPPPRLDHGQPRINTFHHPEKLLRGEDADDHDDPEAA
jgi:HNH endonuclease